MALLDPAMSHLLRRAGFGASAEEAPVWNAMSLATAIDTLVDYESSPDDVDDHIGTPGFLGTTSRGPFEPSSRISDAAQRWVFRMVHSERPLQEKMALFWHHHFATGFSKIAGQLGPAGASRAMAAKPSEDPNDVKGQLELFRELALGNFRDLLLAVSQDVADAVRAPGRLPVVARHLVVFDRDHCEDQALTHSDSGLEAEHGTRRHDCAGGGRYSPAVNR